MTTLKNVFVHDGRFLSLLALNHLMYTPHLHFSCRLHGHIFMPRSQDLAIFVHGSNGMTGLSLHVPLAHVHAHRITTTCTSTKINILYYTGHAYVAIHTFIHTYMIVGSCLATKVFIGNLPAMGRGGSS